MVELSSALVATMTLTQGRFWRRHLPRASVVRKVHLARRLRYHQRQFNSRKPGNMKTAIALITASLALCASVPAMAAAPEPAPKPSVICEAGPTQKQFGKAPWLMYGCADRSSAIIVSGDGNAEPFYAMISLKGNQYRVHSEGVSKGAAATAAMGELKAMSAKQLRSLVEEANKSQ
jgi:hypothetical protein